MEYNNENLVDINQDSYVESDEIVYTSGEVSKMIGISRDLVRYYTKEYSEFLNPEKTKGGHLRYHAADVETLRLILNLLKDYSPAETKAMLKDNNARIIYAQSGEYNTDLYKILLENNKYLVNQIVDILEERLLNTQQNLLEEKKLEIDAYDKLYNEMEEIKEENQQLKDLLNLVLDKLDDAKRKKGIMGWFKK